MESINSLVPLIFFLFASLQQLADDFAVKLQLSLLHTLVSDLSEQNITDPLPTLWPLPFRLSFEDESVFKAYFGATEIYCHLLTSASLFHRRP